MSSGSAFLFTQLAFLLLTLSHVSYVSRVVDAVNYGTSCSAAADLSTALGVGSGFAGYVETPYSQSWWKASSDSTACLQTYATLLSYQTWAWYSFNAGTASYFYFSTDSSDGASAGLADTTIWTSKDCSARGDCNDEGGSDHKSKIATGAITGTLTLAIGQTGVFKSNFIDYPNGKTFISQICVSSCAVCSALPAKLFLPNQPALYTTITSGSSISSSCGTIRRPNYYVFTAHSTGSVFVSTCTLDGATKNHTSPMWIVVYADCTSSETHCLTGDGDCLHSARVTFPVTQGKTYTVVIGTSSSGSYSGSGIPVFNFICADGTYDSDNNQNTACTPCTPVPNCNSIVTCSSASNSVCSSCSNGYFVSNGICSTCSPNSSCLTVTCSNSSNSICASCRDGYYLSNGVCLACTPMVNCVNVTCFSSTSSICTVCSSGFYVNSGGSCSPCTAIPNCNSASTTCTTSSNSICSSCVGGFYTNGDSCGTTCGTAESLAGIVGAGFAGLVPSPYTQSWWENPTCLGGANCNVCPNLFSTINSTQQWVWYLLKAGAGSYFYFSTSDSDSAIATNVDTIIWTSPDCSIIKDCNNDFSSGETKSKLTLTTTATTGDLRLAIGQKAFSLGSAVTDLNGKSFITQYCVSSCSNCRLLPAKLFPPNKAAPYTLVTSGPSVSLSCGVVNMPNYYVFTAPSAGSVFVSTCTLDGAIKNHNKVTIIAVYSDCSSSPILCVTGDSTCFSSAKVTFPVDQGTTYTVVIGTTTSAAYDGTSSVPVFSFTCAAGTYDDDNNQNTACVPCTPKPDCATVTCTSSSNSVCTLCNSGYYLSGAFCLACAPKTNCTSLTCSNGALSTCTACKSGSYLSGDSCSTCSALPNCDTVTCSGGTSSTCTNCNSGYYLNSGSTCSACTPAPNCNSTVTCSGPSNSVCTSCRDDYFLSGTSCTVCGERVNCENVTCTSGAASVCTLCVAGFILNDGNCVPSGGDDDNGNENATSSSSPIAAIGGAVGGGGFLLIILLVIFLRRKRQNRSKSLARLESRQSQSSELDENTIPMTNVSISSNTTFTPSSNTSRLYSGSSTSENDSSSSSNSSNNSNSTGIYATPAPVIPPKPHEYSHLSVHSTRIYDYVTPYAKQVLPHPSIEKDIIMDKVIGNGSFGVVKLGKIPNSCVPSYCKDLIPKESESSYLTCAVKTLKDGSDEKSRRDFADEGKMMANFNHPNVIRMIAVLLDANPPMLVTEFMKYGDLKGVLDKSKTKSLLWYEKELLYVSLQIAQGMEYLQSIKFIHRDLAARNCLVSDNLIVKISDFGLSKELEGEKDYYKLQTKGRLPVKWMAPEAIGFRRFTHATDVWSFGVTMWEVFSYAQSPYGDLRPHDVLTFLENGERLECPLSCLSMPIVYEWMLKCWEQDPNSRPSFSESSKFLSSQMNSPTISVQKIRNIGELL